MPDMETFPKDHDKTAEGQTRNLIGGEDASAAANM